METINVYKTCFDILSGATDTSKISLEDVINKLNEKIAEFTPANDSTTFCLRQRYVQTKAVLEELFNC